MITLTVELGHRSYPIHIGRDLIARAELFAPHLDGPQVLLVSDANVGPRYLPAIAPAFAGRSVEQLTLPAGEQSKSLSVLDSVFDALLEARFSRDCAVVALGGGVVGDIAGLAAACYQRGVRYIQVPTTLLAQVDSSVGGKTAVNHRLGKNMIGAFHQPACVVADTATLDTLSDRELRAGAAEVIKYGLLGDVEFFAWLETNVDGLLRREGAALAHAIERSCRNKARVVAGDEREVGRRALLNLGHTFAHAIEAGVGYGHWLHGEAVAAGLCLAADLSTRLGWLARDEAERVDDLVARAGLPTRVPASIGTARMLDLMALDKKVRAGRTRLVLLRGIGDAVLTDDFDPDALRSTLDERRARA